MRDFLQRLIKAAGLSDAVSGYADVALDGPPQCEVVPAIQLRRPWPPRPVKGLSRIGGLPYLPKGLDWPRDKNGVPLSFLAQIDLNYLPKNIGCLPQSGVLFFFARIDSDMCWDDPVDACKVIFSEEFGSKTLFPKDAPVLGCEIYPASFQSHFLFSVEELARHYPGSSIEASACFTPDLNNADYDLIDFDSYHEMTGFRENPSTERDRLWSQVSKVGWQQGRLLPPQDFLPPTSEGFDFPQLWITVDRISRGILKQIDSVNRRGGWDKIQTYNGESVLQYPNHDLLAIDQVRKEAKNWAQRAGECLMEAVEPKPRAAFLDWLLGVIDRIRDETVPLRRFHFVIRSAMNDTVRQALDYPDAIARLPDDYIARAEPSLQKGIRHQMLGCFNSSQGWDPTDDTLLLSLDSDYGVGFMFCDCGEIQFWISPEDLTRGDFSKVRLSTQGS